MTSSNTRHRSRRTTFVCDQKWRAFDAFKAGISGRKGERAVADRLAALGIPALHDLILVDSLGTTQIDHIAQGPNAILVLETKHYAGRIAGTPDAAEWTQTLGRDGVEYSFQNPLRQNFRHVQAVNAALRGRSVTVTGLVIATGVATFCDALKPTVVSLSGLAAWIASRAPAQSMQELENAMLRLEQIANQNEHLRAAHKGRFSRGTNE